eukprot:937499_1
MGASQSTYRLSHSTCEDDTCNCFCNDKAVQTQYNVPNPTTNCYPKTSDLTNKTLCCKWHRYFFEHSRAPAHCLSIVLINTTSDCDLPGTYRHHTHDTSPRSSQDDNIYEKYRGANVCIPIRDAFINIGSLYTKDAKSVLI